MYRCTFGYYGKLPLSSEFIRYQAAGAEIDELDQWLREGMYHAKSNLGPDWPTDFSRTDTWAFLYLPRDRGRFLSGLLRPSRDKAGREFPFLVYLLLERDEFHAVPWCAPMHFKDFFEQSRRLLSDVDVEFDLNRLQFRLQALSPVEGPETPSVEARYHADLLRRRMRDHWADLFGEFDTARKYEVLQSFMNRRSGENASTPGHWKAKLPLLPLSKEETYDLPFWVDLASRASGREPNTGILLWNRCSSRAKPSLIVSLEGAPPDLLFYLIHPEHWQNCWPGVGNSREPLTEAGRVLLDDGEVTLEAFLYRVSCLRPTRCEGHG